MSYYPTLEEDLQRAKWLLAREPDTDALPLLYKLLESFVAEIERVFHQGKTKQEKRARFLERRAERRKVELR
jgi:hypothetical protein